MLLLFLLPEHRFLSKALTDKIYGFCVHVVPLKATCTHGNRMGPQKRIAGNDCRKYHTSWRDVPDKNAYAWNQRIQSNARRIGLEERAKERTEDSESRKGAGNLL